MSEVKLNEEELLRYARHLSIPEFGIDSQLRLKNASVLVVGAGGLGCPLLLYLAAAGVGKIGIVDFDLVEESNLQRQILYTVFDLGKSKAEIASHKLKALNPNVDIVVHPVRLTVENALDIFKDYDVIADGTDNFPTRYLVNDACVLLDKVNVFASIFRFDGQASVFNFKFEDGSRGPNYRDMFPKPPPPDLVPNCAEGGVLGVLPGIMGSIQATEVIKVITGIGSPLAGRLFLLDASNFQTRNLKIKKNPNTKIVKLINYEEFCGQTEKVKTSNKQVKEISVKDLEILKQGHSKFQLIDVREAFEYEISNLEGELIPLKEIKEAVDRIKKDRKVIIYCKSGSRSAKAIEQLESLFPFDNLYNLRGGILAFAKEVDSSLRIY